MATISTIAERPASGTALVQDSLTGALVIGGAHGSLGVVRSLGRRGVPVWVLVGHHPIAGSRASPARALPGRDPTKRTRWIICWS
jgi:hypothetical protein